MSGKNQSEASSRKAAAAAPPLTRGVRKLQQYLGEDAKALVKPKKAADIVPTLSTHSSSTCLHMEGDLSEAPRLLTEEVMQHLKRCLPLGGTRKLSMRQEKSVASLVSTPSKDSSTHSLNVKRACFPSEEAIWHTIGVAALQRASTLSGSATSDEGSSLFVLTDSDALATRLGEWLRSHYRLLVVVADSAAAPPFPVIPSSSSSSSTRPATKRRGGSKKAEACEESEEPWMAPVFIASPNGFVAWDPRSAAWRCVGALVVLAGSIPTTNLTALSQHRWKCLGHVPLTCVFGVEEAQLVSPSLDWLTTLKPRSPESTATAKKGAAAAVSEALVAPQLRLPVTVHYHVVEGMQRFQFLYALVQGLTPGKGLLVRVATKEMCTFLYDVLYAFLDQLPPFLRLFTDYEGESTYASTHDSASRMELAEKFDAAVMSGTAAPVLISCYGIIPTRGTIFVAYDLLVDLPNFSQFVAEKLTPGAVKAEEVGAGKAEVMRGTVPRKRSRSPIPLDAPARGRRSSPPPPSLPSDSSSIASQRMEQGFQYAFLFLLLRRSEVDTAVTRYLQPTGVRHALQYTPLTKPPPITRFNFVIEKLRSMHRKVFAVQNAAYHAYKATMTVYATLGPRDVYDETKVDLQKVCEEFGYEKIPLLDLRLKDTPFRPKEDYVKASRRKFSQETRATKNFAEKFIHGEGPAEL